MIRNKLYLTGVKLSRNFDKRSLEDSQKLYKIIQAAVDLAHDEDKKKDSDDALEFLVVVYEPYIKKIAYKTFNNANESIFFDDALQETYVTFLNLIYKYDKNIASFSYYINMLLPQYMNVWAQKMRNVQVSPVDVQVIESVVSHPLMDTSSKVLTSFNMYILEKEYTEFIKKRAQKPSRSGTVKEVCYEYFLGNKSCSTIAKDLGITYHAVYEIINKIKEELKEFLKTNIFCEVVITSTGVLEI